MTASGPGAPWLSGVVVASSSSFFFSLLPLMPAPPPRLFRNPLLPAKPRSLPQLTSQWLRSYRIRPPPPLKPSAARSRLPPAPDQSACLHRCCEHPLYIRVVAPPPPTPPQSAQPAPPPPIPLSFIALAHSSSCRKPPLLLAARREKDRGEGKKKKRSASAASPHIIIKPASRTRPQLQLHTVILLVYLFAWDGRTLDPGEPCPSSLHCQD